jgi:hypothetical protein
MGDGTTYGYDVTGHGGPGIDKSFSECHDLIRNHVDRDGRITLRGKGTSWPPGSRSQEEFQLCFVFAGKFEITVKILKEAGGKVIDTCQDRSAFTIE